MKEHFELVGLAKGEANAFNFFNKHHKYIDMIFMEVYLPGSNCFNLIKILKQMKKELIVIVITKSRNKEDINRAASCKVDGYMTKPVNKIELLKMLKKIISERKFLV